MSSWRQVKHLWKGWLKFFKQLFIYFPVDLFLSRRENPLAYRLRTLLEELGPVFVKFGQVVSTRSELLPDGFLKELEKLQDKTSPFSTEGSRKIIAEQLGTPPEELFEEFTDQPAAAASLAQVHSARLKNGDKVAVKVRRPGVARTLPQDIAILHSLARWVERLAPAAQKIRMREAVREFDRDINTELDFQQEKKHMDEMRGLVSGNKKVKVPRTYDRFSRRKVLTTEWLTGIKVNRVDQLQEAGHERSEVAEAIGQIYLWQLLELGIFHSDPHPGNIFVLEEGRIGLVDFGTLGRLKENERIGLHSLLLAAVEKDSSRLALTLNKLGMIPREEVAGLREELEELIDRHYKQRLEKIKLGRLLYQILNQVIRKHEFKLPTGYSRLVTVAITVENLCESLDPDYRWSEAVSSYPAEGELSEAEWRMLKERIQETARFLIEAPRRLDRALNQLESGDIAGPSKEELEEIANQMGASGPSIGLGLATASLVGGGAFLLAGNHYQAAYAVLGIATLGFLRLIWP